MNKRKVREILEDEAYATLCHHDFHQIRLRSDNYEMRVDRMDESNLKQYGLLRFKDVFTGCFFG